MVVEGRLGEESPKSKVQPPSSRPLRRSGSPKSGIGGFVEISGSCGERAGGAADFGGGSIGKSSSDGTNSTLALHECARGIGAGSWVAEIASVMKVGQKPS